MKQTAVEWLAIEWNRIDNKWKNVGQGHKHCVSEKAEALKQAKAMEKVQSHKYAEFAIRCDRMDMKILNFEDWIKLETFKSE